jgi:hypothetical protein
VDPVPNPLLLRKSRSSGNENSGYSAENRQLRIWGPVALITLPPIPAKAGTNFVHQRWSSVGIFCVRTRNHEVGSEIERRVAPVRRTDLSKGDITSIFRVTRLWFFPACSEVMPHYTRHRELLVTAPPKSCLFLTLESLLMGCCFVECVSDIVTLKMETICISETSFLLPRVTWRHLPKENDFPKTHEVLWNKITHFV